MAEQKKTPSENGDFKTAPLGFDKNEVMAYIVNHNKTTKALKEENEQLKKALEEKEAQAPSEEMLAEIEKKKADLDAQILESRKQILDERRKLAQTEKELHVAQAQYKELNEEFAEYKKRTAQKLENAKKSGGKLNPAQLGEISAKANADANAVIADAQKKAEEIIAAAKSYFSDTVSKANTYKQTVSEKVGSCAENISANAGAISASVDVFELLSSVAQQINDAVNSAIESASEKAKEGAPSDSSSSKISEAEEVMLAKQAIDSISAVDESAVSSYEPMKIAPYNFKLKLDMPENSAADSDDDDMTNSTADGVLSSFTVTPEAPAQDAEEQTASDDFIDLIVQADTPKPEVKVEEDDISDLLTPAQPAVEKSAPAKEEAEPVQDDDFSDLLAGAPAMAFGDVSGQPEEEASLSDDISDLLAQPVDEPAKEEKPADDFSDLIMGGTVPQPPVHRERQRDDYTPAGTNKEKLNESRSMGVAGKEEKPDDPWKALEAEMNGLTITPPPAPAPVPAPAPAPAAKDTDLDDGLSSAFDDSPAVPVKNETEETIDMSEYSSMLSGENDATINSVGAQYDPSWDFKLIEGAEDGDDEMSTDNVGFFDL